MFSSAQGERLRESLQMPVQPSHISDRLQLISVVTQLLFKVTETRSLQYCKGQIGRSSNMQPGRRLHLAEISPVPCSNAHCKVLGF